MVSSEAAEMCQPSRGVVIKRYHMHINTHSDSLPSVIFTAPLPLHLYCSYCLVTLHVYERSTVIRKYKLQLIMDLNDC